MKVVHLSVFLCFCEWTCSQILQILYYDPTEKCRWPLNHLLQLIVSGAEVPADQHPKQPCHVHTDLFCFYCSLIWRRGFDWHFLQPRLVKMAWNEPQYLEPAPGCGRTESNLFIASSRVSREQGGGAGRVCYLALIQHPNTSTRSTELSATSSRFVSARPSPLVL